MTGAAIATAPEGPLIVQPAAGVQTSLSVIVPTFQESANIGLFLTALCETLDPVLPGSYEIVVVDDDSPDGTLEIAAGVVAGHPQIRLVRRAGGRELATAVIRGWQVAQGRVLSTINADFQHPPALIAGMWKLVQNVDLVVASRYCKGGSVGDWAMLRRLFSRGAQLLGIMILPQVFRRVTDPLSGCFMVRREALTGVELNPLGYKSLVEVLARGRVKSIAEFPYQMRSRERGESKATGARSLDFVLQLWRLRKAWSEARR
jgi:dolichol-phosphate mannosyltransferase